MAVLATHLITARDNTDLTFYTTGAFTPSANKLILAAIGVQVASGSAAPPTSLTGNSLTWVQVGTVNVGLRSLSIWRAMGASPTLGTLVIDYNLVTQANCEWSITEFDGIDTSGTNGSGAVTNFGSTSGNSTSGTVNLAAFSSVNNATFGAFHHNANEDTTEGSGFTRLGETHGTGASMGLLSEWRATNDISVDASWVTSALYRGVGLEIIATTISTFTPKVIFM